MTSPEEYLDDLKEWGRRAYDSYDVEALQNMMELYLEEGYEEKAYDLYEDLQEAIQWWEEETGLEYDVNLKHWRDPTTGRFAPDPYEHFY